MTLSDQNQLIPNMPEAEAGLVERMYRQASVILEYGSGGSTRLAAGMPDKRIFTVESDPNWIARLHDWFVDHPPASMPLLHHADIGPTRNWGHPANDSAFRRWPAYVQGIWDHRDFLAPDVVLIDGRFRLACLLTTALRTVQSVVALVDDYIDRPTYHEAETILGAPEMIGRMARFDLVPGMIPMTRLRLVIDSHMRPL